MNIEWTVAATIAAPIIALFAGVWINRRFESRPNLVYYFGHVSTFRQTPATGSPMVVHSHTVILRNSGRRPATNVRLHHVVLPDFNIWPNVAHTIEVLDGGGRDLVIPCLVPGEEITVSYLYFPPLTVAQVNANIKSDYGFAQETRVLLQRQYPSWVNRTVAVLILLGAAVAAYWAFIGVRAIIRLWWA